MKLRGIKTDVRVAFLTLAATLALGAAAATAGPSAVAVPRPDPDRYIVSFLDVGKGRAALQAAGARIELELSKQEAVAAHIPARALQALRNNPYIEYIEPDALRYPMAQVTPWGIPAVQANLVSDTNAASRKVCVIDSGYSQGHEDLPSATNSNVTGQTGTTWYQDTCYHGTHVAGTIAALNNDKGVVGVLPSGSVGLHIVKVFDGASCGWSYSSTLVAALNECASAGANVVSMSLGGGVKSRTEDRAFADAYNAGILSVAAAGNDGNTRMSYPASYNSVISVAAVDSANVVASFSQQNSQVELAGPGVAVRSTVGMGVGLEESLLVGGTSYEATAFEGSAKASATKPLFECKAVDGLGSPGDCAGASGRVCLIKRGTISFAEKVTECQSKGGVAAVIYNNADALFSGTLGTTATTIPAVGVSGTNGASLLARVGSDATVTVGAGNYAFYDGTSMATPHVSGVAALVWSVNTGCTNADVRNALAATAKDLGPAGRDVAYGFGLVQAKAASDALASCGGSGGGGGGGGSCDLLPVGASCSADADCCSGTCKGKPGAKVCK